MVDKLKIFHRLLLKNKPILLLGTHNGVSAKIAERMKFDAIWASSFEISASQGLPDANLLSFWEIFQIVKNINDSVNIPVIVDCNSGYGNAINVIRMTKEYEAIGIAGICIEDNVFPKRCSFYENVKRKLVSAKEQVNKIRAIINTRKRKDFFIIARTEALVANYTMKEALRRANLYAKAGADAILVHSNSQTPDEIYEFAKRWQNKKIPLVAIPTTYNKVSVDKLSKQGLKIIIFANQMIRGAIFYMETIAKILKEKKQASYIEKSIAPLEKVFDYVNLKKLQEDEKKYLS